MEWDWKLFNQHKRASLKSLTFKLTSFANFEESEPWWLSGLEWWLETARPWLEPYPGRNCLNGAYFGLLVFDYNRGIEAKVDPIENIYVLQFNERDNSSAPHYRCHTMHYLCYLSYVPGTNKESLSWSDRVVLRLEGFGFQIHWGRHFWWMRFGSLVVFNIQEIKAHNPHKIVKSIENSGTLQWNDNILIEWKSFKPSLGNVFHLEITRDESSSLGSRVVKSGGLTLIGRKF